MTDDCDHDIYVRCARCCTCDVCRMLRERGWKVDVPAAEADQ